MPPSSHGFSPHRLPLSSSFSPCNPSFPPDSLKLPFNLVSFSHPVAESLSKNPILRVSDKISRPYLFNNDFGSTSFSAKDGFCLPRFGLSGQHWEKGLSPKGILKQCVWSTCSVGVSESLSASVPIGEAQDCSYPHVPASGLSDLVALSVSGLDPAVSEASIHSVFHHSDSVNGFKHSDMYGMDPTHVGGQNPAHFVGQHPAKRTSCGMDLVHVDGQNLDSDRRSAQPSFQVSSDLRETSTTAFPPASAMPPSILRCSGAASVRLASPRVSVGFPQDHFNLPDQRSGVLATDPVQWSCGEDLLPFSLLPDKQLDDQGLLRWDSDQAMPHMLQEQIQQVSLPEAQRPFHHEFDGSAHGPCSVGGYSQQTVWKCSGNALPVLDSGVCFPPLQAHSQAPIFAEAVRPHHTRINPILIVPFAETNIPSCHVSSFEGFPSIQISSSDFQKASSGHLNTLIVKFLGGRRPNMKNFHQHVISSWGLDLPFMIGLLNPRAFFIKLSSVEDFACAISRQS